MIVQTTAGKLEGFERDGRQRFRGIPFAAPPVGDLRFRPPQPMEPWTDVRPATKFGPTAPQGLGGLEAMLGAAQWAQSEDCLYLNVITPACDDAARPVMVWIHGGAFVAGAGSVPWYSGSELVRHHDVVVVSINYRLGALGFTHLGPALGEAYASSGNSGILDQIAALEWVRDNIAAFGGDPGNVTIFGESAGGMSVGTLLGTPAASGLFRRAIAQSGACANVTPGEQAADIPRELAAEIGGGVEALLTADVEAVLAAQQAVAMKRLDPSRRTQGMSLLGFQPVIDGVTIPRPPIEAVRDGSAAGVDLIAGTTAHEFTLFNMLGGNQSLTDDGLRNRVALAVGNSAPDVIAAYREQDPAASVDDLWTAIATDAIFRMPTLQLLEAQAAHRPDNTFGYLFTYESTAFDGKLRSAHGLDVPFTFDMVSGPGVELFVGEVTDSTRALAANMREAWTTFATTGRPAAADLPEWPAYDADRRATMELGVPCQVVDDPGAAARKAWEAV